MKKVVFLIIIIILLLATNVVLARDLIVHSWMMTDYSAPSANDISESVEMDKTNITAFFEELKENKDKLDFDNVRILEVSGRFATRSKVKDALKNERLGSNDVFLLFFSGHGGMVNGEQYIVLSDMKSLYEDDLVEIIERKNPALSWYFIDACSYDVGGRRNTVDAVDTLTTILSPRIGIDYERLNRIFKAKGKIIQRATGAGHLAYGNSELGGFYTYSVLKSLQKPKSSSIKVLCEQIKEKTEKVFEDHMNSDYFPEGEEDAMQDIGQDTQSPDNEIELEEDNPDDSDPDDDKPTTNEPTDTYWPPSDDEDDDDDD